MLVRHEYAMVCDAKANLEDAVQQTEVGNTKTEPNAKKGLVVCRLLGRSCQQRPATEKDATETMASYNRT